MSMSTGGSGGSMSEMNVTPLIDVLLVLLIIFMVIVPVTPKGLQTAVPQPPKNKTQDQPNDRTIVVQVQSNGGAPATYKINDTDFSKAALEPKLEEIYAARAEKVMFIKGDKDLDFAKIAEVVDFGHKAGVETIAMITPRVAAGQ
jgi:biopolymer transport protein TolR